MYTKKQIDKKLRDNLNWCTIRKMFMWAQRKEIKELEAFLNSKNRKPLRFRRYEKLE